MTQEEKIKQAGYAAYYDPYDPEATAKQDAFKEGARWAYEHPKVTEGLDDCSREDLLGLIEFYRQAIDVQGKTVRILAIDKACQWLQENLDDYLDVGVTFLVSDFKKAMQNE